MPRCLCGRHFSDQSHLLAHQIAQDCMAGSMPSPIPLLRSRRGAVDATNERIELDISKIQQEALHSSAELHYEHYIPTAHKQHFKEASERIAKLQSSAIKRALHGKLLPGTSLDELIDPIMEACKIFKDKRAEEKGIRVLTSEFPVKPRRRVLREGDIVADIPELFMYDVPIEESIEREMQYNPHFAQYMVDWHKYPSSGDGQYKSLRDGMASRNHPVLGDDEYDGIDRLAFAYYYDDVEVVNPIGTARTKHKLALHYVQVLNAPPDLVSDMDTIFLVGVVLSKTQDEIGISDIVQGPINEDVNGTSFGASMRRFGREEGMGIRVGSGLTHTSQYFRAFLLVVSADALAAAELLGRQKSFGPKVRSICWQCDAPGQGHKVPDPHVHFSPCTHVKWKSDYEHYMTLKTNAERNAFLSSRSIKSFMHAFNRVPHVKCVEIMPFDLMHVELEGNLKVHLYGFLHMAIKKYKWFKLAAFNFSMKRFKFITIGAKRPTPISLRQLKGCKSTVPGLTGIIPRGDGTIVMTSGDMLRFVTHCIEIIRPLMTIEALQSAEYAALVAHVKYFNMLMSRHFTDTSIAELGAAILDAQQKFLDVPAYAKLWKPKNHFATHFPADIKRFGPPRGYWCMRFEAKNQQHKRAAKMGRWVDVPGTVARFWAKRSHLRLLRKRNSSLVTQSTPAHMRYIMHPEVDIGTWIRVLRIGNPNYYIAHVVELSTDDGLLYVRAFNAATIMQEASDGQQYVHPPSLNVEVETTTINLDDTKLVIVRLLQCEGGDGLIRFVAQP